MNNFKLTPDHFNVWVNDARRQMAKRHFNGFCQAMQHVVNIAAIEGFVIPGDLMPYVAVRRLR